LSIDAGGLKIDSGNLASAGSATTTYLANVRFVSPVVRQLESGICPVRRYGVYSQALATHKRAGELKRLMEQAYKQRDALLEPVDAIIRQSRDVLKGIYRNEPRKIGEFGFNVVAAPRSKKTEMA